MVSFTVHSRCTCLLTSLLEMWSCHIAYSVQYLHHKRAIVMAIDTDVIMMCIYYITHLDGLQELWVKKMDSYLPAHKPWQ